MDNIVKNEYECKLCTPETMVHSSSSVKSSNHPPPRQPTKVSSTCNRHAELADSDNI